LHVRLAAAFVPAGSLDAKNRDRHLAGFCRNNEINPERAVLASPLDDVPGLDKEVQVPGILDQELVYVPGLVEEGGVVFHGLFEDAVVGNILSGGGGDEPCGEVFCGGGLGESFHIARKIRTPTGSKTVLPPNFFEIIFIAAFHWPKPMRGRGTTSVALPAKISARE